MALKRYEVDLGRGRITTMQLSPEDAKRYGARATLAGKAAPSNKARTASTKTPTSPSGDTPPSAA